MDDLKETLNTKIDLYLYKGLEEDMFPFYIDHLTVEEAFEATKKYIKEYSNKYPDLVIEACIGGCYGHVFFKYEEFGKRWFCAKKHPELQDIINKLNKK